MNLVEQNLGKTHKREEKIVCTSGSLRTVKWALKWYFDPCMNFSFDKTLNLDPKYNHENFILENINL